LKNKKDLLIKTGKIGQFLYAPRIFFCLKKMFNIVPVDWENPGILHLQYTTEKPCASRRTNRDISSEIWG